VKVNINVYTYMSLTCLVNVFFLLSLTYRFSTIILLCYRWPAWWASALLVAELCKTYYVVITCVVWNKYTTTTTSSVVHLTCALSLPLKWRPQTTCLHPALSWSADSIFLRLYLKFTVHISFWGSLFQVPGVNDLGTAAERRQRLPNSLMKPMSRCLAAY